MRGKKKGTGFCSDYGHVIIHVFYEPVRAFYDLEGLWIDAKRIETKRFLTDPHEILRPLKNKYFCSSSRKAKILTTDIH